MKNASTNIYSFNTSDHTKINDFLYFFALYDEKMIYNAEMYINEGNSDYNGNDQITIRPWTRFSDNYSIDQSVAYSFGCRDSVDDFNRYMGEQGSLVNGDPYYTLAPGGNWNNYIANPTGTTPLYAYRPGYSTWAINKDPEKYQYYPNPTNDYKIATTQSAGIDCSGLVQRAARNRYKLPDIGELNGKYNPDKWQPSSATYEMPYTGSFCKIEDYSYVIDDNALVPGDLLQLAGVHVVIVRDIKFVSSGVNAGKRVIDISNSHVIECTGDPQWRVIKTNTLSTYPKTSGYERRRLSY